MPDGEPMVSDIADEFAAAHPTLHRWHRHGTDQKLIFSFCRMLVEIPSTVGTPA